jgi:hypothetical protein
MAAKGTFLVPTFVTYEKLHERGRERGLTAAQLAKLDLVLGSGLDGLRRARAAGVRIGSGSDLLGPLSRHKAREPGPCRCGRVICRHRAKIGSCWRKLNAGRPARPRPGTVLEGWPT